MWQRAIRFVPLAVAESNAVCVLSCGGEQCGARPFSSITLEKLMNTNTSRKTGFFCFQTRILPHALSHLSLNFVTFLCARSLEP